MGALCSEADETCLQVYDSGPELSDLDVCSSYAGFRILLLRCMLQLLASSRQACNAMYTTL